MQQACVYAAEHRQPRHLAQVQTEPSSRHVPGHSTACTGAAHPVLLRMSRTRKGARTRTKPLGSGPRSGQRTRAWAGTARPRAAARPSPAGAARSPVGAARSPVVAAHSPAGAHSPPAAKSLAAHMAGSSHPAASRQARAAWAVRLTPEMPATAVSSVCLAHLETLEGTWRHGVVSFRWLHKLAHAGTCTAEPANV